eukprot:CAMPEP_0203940536 /NCGR_PEP_ID=MMETSP0359-20131031/77105_1 /ASSEMBLY_ACC=CAM_ASM_000338 /TAXON_ID=268821 /ORGANISM="Scrippsiella Hangoei, Strain SHTV-5" /LENGTH=445 /DNA_ID=CAMNT_0050870985 /DNA_START=23 /DNA_END=1359 /DNA_ORIENTATION=-
MSIHGDKPTAPRGPAFCRGVAAAGRRCGAAAAATNATAAAAAASTAMADALASAASTAQQEVHEEVARFAEMEPHPTSLEDILACLEPWRVAKFIHTEMPIRFAERIRLISNIPGWEEISELVTVHDLHLKAFRNLRLVERHPTLDEFTAVVKGAMRDQEEVVRLMAEAMHKLQERDPQQFGPAFVDRFLDSFLLNRFGSNVLMSQYLALVNLTHGPTGIVDPQCNPAKVCREAAKAVLDVCEEVTGRRPDILVETYSSAKGVDLDFNGVPRFSYIPGALRYVMCELLKNSCRATVEACASDAEIEQKPVRVIVCADDHRVAICTSDQAGGIPFEVGSHVWSYLYSTARKNATAGGFKARTGRADELAGFGVGLPISRLYARYLGGSLDLISLPGYGTHAYLFLPRLSSQQVEVVPDRDAHFRYHTLGDYALATIESQQRQKFAT